MDGAGEPRRGRTRSPEDKRARILEAARTRFADRGYGPTTTAEIARLAGVSEGTVFHHFGSKRALLSAVSAQYGRDLATAMFRGLLPNDAPDVGSMIRAVFAFVREHGNLHQLLARVEDPSVWSEAAHTHRAVIIGALAAALERWAAQGLVKTARPRHAAVLCFGLVESALTECFVHGHGDDAEAFLDEAVRLVEAGLGMHEGHAAERTGAVQKPSLTR